jgi:hypothetical protein
MPKKFKFYTSEEDYNNHNDHFQCELESNQCEAMSGRPHNQQHQCRNSTVIGSFLCWQHLMRDHHLRILPSQYGQGLFAFAREHRHMPANTPTHRKPILFRVGAEIVEYDGEILNDEQLIHRYDDKTAPYAAEKSKESNQNRYIDSACVRGVGSLINHANEANKNARFSVGRERVVVRATKIIRQGQEILINYNFGGRRDGQGYDLHDGSYHTTI